MKSLETIKSKLMATGGIDFEAIDNTILIKEKNLIQFEVKLEILENEYLITYGMGHEHFDNENDAMQFLAFLLSSQCRLKTYSKGNFAYKWRLETLENNEWIEHSTNGLLIFPYWRKTIIKTQTNKIFD